MKTENLGMGHFTHTCASERGLSFWVSLLLVAGLVVLIGLIMPPQQMMLQPTSSTSTTTTYTISSSPLTISGTQLTTSYRAALRQPANPTPWCPNSPFKDNFQSYTSTADPNDWELGAWTATYGMTQGAFLVPWRLVLNGECSAVTKMAGYTTNACNYYNASFNSGSLKSPQFTLSGSYSSFQISWDYIRKMDSAPSDFAELWIVEDVAGNPGIKLASMPDNSGNKVSATVQIPAQFNGKNVKIWFDAVADSACNGDPSNPGCPTVIGVLVDKVCVQGVMASMSMSAPGCEQPLLLVKRESSNLNAGGNIDLVVNPSPMEPWMLSISGPQSVLWGMLSLITAADLMEGQLIVLVGSEDVSIPLPEEMSFSELELEAILGEDPTCVSNKVELNIVP